MQIVLFKFLIYYYCVVCAKTRMCEMADLECFWLLVLVVGRCFILLLGKFFVLVWFLVFCCCSFGLGFFGGWGSNSIGRIPTIKILTSLLGSKIHIGRKNVG